MKEQANFDVLIVGRKGDEGTGERDQLAVRIQIMQLDVFLPAHAPCLAEVPVIGGNAADVDPVRVPVCTVNQFAFLFRGPAGCPLHRGAGQAVGAGVVPADHCQTGLDARGRSFPEQIAVQPPSCGARDHQIRMIFLEQVAVDVGGVFHLAFDQSFAGVCGFPQLSDLGADHRHAHQFFRHRGFVTALPQMAVDGGGVDFVRSAHPAQEMFPVLVSVVHFVEVLLALIQPQPFNVKVFLPEFFLNLVCDAVIGQDHDFDPAVEHGPDHIGL